MGDIGAHCQLSRWSLACEIIRRTGKRRHWNYARLQDWSHVCYTIEKGAYGGKPARFFPPCVVAILLAEANRYPTREEWLTRHEICKLLEINRRVADKLLFSFQDNARIRRDKGNRKRRHYPPHVVKRLKALVAVW